MRPWYPFYPGDYQADTKFLSPMADLVYRRLLDEYWMNQGPLPLNYSAIALAIRLDVRVVKRYLRGELCPYWHTHDDVIINARMQAEIEKSSEIHTARARAGKQGGLAKAKANAIAKALAPQLQLQSHNNKDVSAQPNSSDRDASAVQKPGQKIENVPRETPENGPLNGRDYIPQMGYTEQDVVDLYNKMLPELIPIKKITWRLQHDIRNIHTTTEIGCHEIKHWTNFFKRVKRSDWLTGRANGKPSRYSLRKLIEPECYAKIAEGTYD